MKQACSQEDLARCRERIDQIDIRLLDLLNERTAIVEEIGRIKQDLRLAVYEPKREEQVFQNVLGHNRGPMPGDAVKRIFERIIDEMRHVQKLKILGSNPDKDDEPAPLSQAKIQKEANSC